MKIIRSIHLPVITALLLLSGCKSHQNKVSIICVNRFPETDTTSMQKPAGPHWMHNAVFYEIYPQSYYDSNGDGIGDLKGICAKLDYVKSLGVDAIWLNPFYESPFRDAGYDVSDYYKVAPRYGTNDDVKELFRLAKEKGLHIIIDFVPGHTSVDHPWFKASCSPVPNKYSNWYIWTSSTWFTGMENYRENFIQGYCNRDGNYMINYFWHQPALNYGWGQPDTSQKKWQLDVDHPDVIAVKEEMKNIMRFWLDMGASGFRCDMAGSLVKNDPDKKICKFWQDVRKMLDEKYPDAFIISEWSDPKTAIDGGFHADFMHWFPGYDNLWANSKSYFNEKGSGDLSGFLQKYLEQYQSIYGKGYISLPVGNHDLARINRDGRDKKDIELIYVFQFTMPNIPFIYYGDEIGMRNIPGLVSKEGSYGRSSSRAPMQWSEGKNLGFSAGTEENLYLPVDTSANAPTVAQQEADSTSLIHFVRELVKLKKEQPALMGSASFYPVYAMPNAYPFVYMRTYRHEKIIIALNPSSARANAVIEGELHGEKELIFGSALQWENKKGKTTISITGKSYAIYKIR